MTKFSGALKANILKIIFNLLKYDKRKKNDVHKDSKTKKINFEARELYKIKHDETNSCILLIYSFC